MALRPQYGSAYKVGYAEPEAREFRFENIFAREDRKGTSLLCIATSGGPIELMKKLIDSMAEPLWLLYVLSVPRGEGEAGRYQSAQVFSRNETNTFLHKFSNFLTSDARHNFWIKAEQGSGLLVLDEHNLIYAYGPIDEWAAMLAQQGWREVAEGEIRLPSPHEHYFHEIFDDDAKRLLDSQEWIYSPLRPQDRN